MAIVFGLCIGTGGRFDAVARPAIERVRSPEDVVLTDDGSRGICKAYNDFLDTSADLQVDAVVLMHDDVCIVDPDFRSKVLAIADDPTIGLAGVIGASGLRGLEWWRGRRLAGAVDEHDVRRGYLRRAGDVHAVDGLLLVVTRSALKLRFDDQRFPAFHGYDVDYSLSVVSNGLRVVVRPIRVHHFPKGGLGDETAFWAANESLITKWPDMIDTSDPFRGLRTSRNRMHARLRNLPNKIKSLRS